VCVMFQAVLTLWCQLCVCNVSGCTHTLVSVVLVDLQGVEQIARCFSLYSAFVSVSLLTGSPFMGLCSLLQLVLDQYRYFSYHSCS